MTTKACQSQGGTLCPQIFGSVSFPLRNNTSLDKGLLSGHLTKLTFWVYFSCIYFYLDCHKKRLLKKKKLALTKLWIKNIVSPFLCPLSFANLSNHLPPWSFPSPTPPDALECSVRSPFHQGVPVTWPPHDLISAAILAYPDYTYKGWFSKKTK